MKVYAGIDLHSSNNYVGVITSTSGGGYDSLLPDLALGALGKEILPRLTGRAYITPAELVV